MFSKLDFFQPRLLLCLGSTLTFKGKLVTDLQVSPGYQREGTWCKLTKGLQRYTYVPHNHR